MQGRWWRRTSKYDAAPLRRSRLRTVMCPTVRVVSDLSVLWEFTPVSFGHRPWSLPMPQRESRLVLSFLLLGVEVVECLFREGGIGEVDPEGAE